MLSRCFPHVLTPPYPTMQCTAISVIREHCRRSMIKSQNFHALSSFCSIVPTLHTLFCPIIDYSLAVLHCTFRPSFLTDYLSLNTLTIANLKSLIESGCTADNRSRFESQYHFMFNGMYIAPFTQIFRNKSLLLS